MFVSTRHWQNFAPSVAALRGAESRNGVLTGMSDTRSPRSTPTMPVPEVIPAVCALMRARVSRDLSSMFTGEPFGGKWVRRSARVHSCGLGGGAGRGLVAGEAVFDPGERVSLGG